MANNAIAEATVNSKRKQELEKRERNIQGLIREMAKSMIYENQDYISNEITEEAVEVIDNMKESPQKATRSRNRKGAE